MERLTICIPTYNRKNALLKNVFLIEEILLELHANESVEILISDNGTPCFEDTEKQLISFKNVTVAHNKENIGPARNYISVISNARTKWVMLLGDDDYFFADYLIRVLKYINDPSVSVVIPNFYQVNELGEEIGIRRDKCVPDKRYAKGDISLMWKGHQLSGLVFKKSDGLMNALNNKAKFNQYIEIYMIAYNMLLGDTIHITECPLKNTLIRAKNWNYSFDNLFGELLKNVYGLGLSEARENDVIDKLLHHEFLSRVCYLQNYFHPLKVCRRIKTYELSKKNQKKAKRIFLQGYLKFPHRLFIYLIKGLYNKIKSKK
jgi:glycosyltransferase involved in cell wall biosynthesis